MHIQCQGPEALDDASVPLSTLKLSEEQKCNQFCRLILVSNASDPKSGFYKGNDRLLRWRGPLIAELQKIAIPHGLQGTLCVMTHHHKLAGNLGVTQMDATLH